MSCFFPMTILSFSCTTMLWFRFRLRFNAFLKSIVILPTLLLERVTDELVKNASSVTPPALAIISAKVSLFFVMGYSPGYFTSPSTFTVRINSKSGTLRTTTISKGSKVMAPIPLGSSARSMVTELISTSVGILSCINNLKISTLLLAASMVRPPAFSKRSVKVSEASYTIFLGFFTAPRTSTKSSS